MKTVSAFIYAHWIALAVLLAALVIHFWLIILHPGSVLYGGPGDHTASLIWLYEKSPGNPWWGWTDASAFPFGENLWSPTYVLGQLLYVLFWLCSAPFGSGVVGYNLLTTLGFIVSFLSFYVLTRNLWQIGKPLAALGSYVMAFTPFALSLNTVGHLSYVFAPAASMMVVWLFMKLFTISKSKQWRRYALGLGLFVGLSWLFDPYFLLFLTLLGGSLFVGRFATRGRGGLRGRKLRQRAGLSLAVFLCCVAPLGIYSLVQRQAIDNNTSYRASIENDAQQYSARLEDYVLPSPYNPISPSVLISMKEMSVHGPSAAPLYVSLILLLVIVGLIVLRVRRKRKIEQVVILCLIATAVMIGFSLPPKIHIGGFELLTPVYVIIQFSSVWRVFSRIFIFLYPLLCIATFILAQSTWKESGKYVRCALVIALCIIPLDMLIRNPFDASLFWNIHQNIPSTYSKAHVNRNDKIAEYPLREAPHYKGSLYFSAQLSHDASIVNPMMPDTTKRQEGVRRALADLNNPQTIGALKFMGVTKVQMWTSGSESFAIPAGLTLLAEDNYEGFFGKQKVQLYSIGEQVRPIRYIVEHEEASRLWDDKITDIKDSVVSTATLRIVDLCDSFKGVMCSGVESVDNVVNVRLLNDSQTEVAVHAADSSDEYILSPMSERVIDIKGANVTIKSSATIAVVDYHVRMNNE